MKICHDCKPNTVTDKTKHFNSTGKMYTIRNRANYDMLNGSSINKYATKKCTMEVKNKERTFTAN